MDESMPEEEKPEEKDDFIRLTEKEDALLRDLAQKVVRWGMSVPAVFMLEPMKPLNFVSSQMLVGFGPFIDILYPQVDLLASALQKRESIDRLIEHIEDMEAKKKQAEIGESNENGKPDEKET